MHVEVTGSAGEGLAARYAQPGARAWAVLAILCFVYVLNFLDRQLLSILAKPIQDELGVTDGQLGLISGLYFALFYCMLAIPVGWLADRTNRVRVLSFACALWSAATVACGLSSNYRAAGGRAHVGRRRRGGRRAAVLRHHLRLLSARHARHGARPLQPRAADRAGAGRRVRRVDRRRLQLALRLHLARRRRHRHRADRVAVRARAEARRPRCAGARRAAATRPRQAAVLADLPHVLRATRCCCACRWPAARRSSSPTRR